jgi:CRP-like cAMP-binding protein
VPRSTDRPAAKNRLLELIPRDDRNRLLAAGEQVELKAGEVLRESEKRIRHVIFPTGSSVSVIAPIHEAANLQVALVASEGVVGLPVAFGVNVSPLRAVVNGSGLAWRIGAQAFSREFECCPPLRRVLSRYLYVLMSQISQTAACSTFHDVEPRLARWLLMTADGAHCDQFSITQAFISSMLGVRREGVSRAATLLQQRKLISYARGQLKILDRRGLQAAACDCYARSRKTYAAILG